MFSRFDKNSLLDKNLNDISDIQNSNEQTYGVVIPNKMNPLIEDDIVSD